MNLHKYFRGHLWLLSPSLGNTILYFVGVVSKVETEQ